MSPFQPSRNTLTLNHRANGAHRTRRNPNAGKLPSAEQCDLILRSPTVMNSPSFQVFFDALLADSEVVKTFHTFHVLELQNPYQSLWPISTGLQSSEEASSRARTSPMILPTEREIAGVAAFVAGLGLYMLHRSGLSEQSRPPTRLALHWAQEYRVILLEEPLRALRRRAPGLAGLMADVLEMPFTSESSDPDQVARVLSAVRMATLPTQALWLTDLTD